MRSGKFNGCRINAPQKQRGVVLLIALIIMVVMTLAGIGMMRSVDTGSIIAGNLAFKQATLHANDAGTRAGFNALMSVANSNNNLDKAILNFNNGQPCTNAAGATAAGCPGGNINLPGYWSSCAGGLNGDQSQCLLASNTTWWTDNANWANTPSVTVTDPNGATIATVNYIIHRMCTTQGPSNGQVCHTSTLAATGCSKTQLLPCTSTSIYYRITSRSTGLRNTVTYTQSLVLIAQ